MKRRRISMKTWRRLAQAAQVVLGLAAGAALGLLAIWTDMEWAGFRAGGAGTSLICVTLAMAAYLVWNSLHVILHEAGHLACGRMSGYGFVSFRVFSHMWQKDAEGRIRHRRYRLPGTAGQCLMSPPEPLTADSPMALYHLGGILANLLTAAMAALLTLIPGTHPLVRLALWSGTVTGLLAAVLNALPFPGSAADGRNLYEALRSRKVRLILQRELKAAVLGSRGVPAAEFPAEWFEDPTDDELRESVILAWPAALICDRLMAEDRRDEAAAMIDRLLAEDTAVLPSTRLTTRTDGVILELLGEGREERLRDLMKDDLPKQWRRRVFSPGAAVARYAWARLADRDAAAAGEALKAFGKVAAVYPYPAVIDEDRRLLAQIDEKAGAAEA